MNIVEYLNTLPRMLHIRPAGELDITLAENELGLTFAPEYRMLLKELGEVCIGSHELTGLSEEEDDNVVALTRSARKLEKLPKEFYVIENLGIDDMFLVQNERGEIWQCQGTARRLIAASIQDYLRLVL